MHCYTHREAEAVGVCGICGRAVCDTCARLTPTKVTCSEACAADAATQKSIIEFSQRSVTVTKSMRIPSTTIFTGGMGLVFIGWGAFEHVIHGRDFDWFIIVLGALFLLAAANTYRITKKVTREP